MVSSLDMNNELSEYNKLPRYYNNILSESKNLGFSLYSDNIIGLLLRSFVSAKTHSTILELGTGTGLGALWIVDGLGEGSEFHTVESDSQLLSVFTKYFQKDNRVKTFNMDGEVFIKEKAIPPYDIIFADTWPGKYLLLDETLDLLKPGGLYIIDDMNIQPGWPDEHTEKASRLVKDLNGRSDLLISNLNISTGIIIATKIG